MAALIGSYPHAVILCRYKEYEGTIPDAPVEYFEEMFVSSGNGSLSDYWSDISGSRINLEGTRVFGWYYLDMTRAEEQEWVTAKKAVDPHFSFRFWRIANALNIAASKGVDFQEFYGAVVIYEYPGETGAVGKGPVEVTVAGQLHQLALCILDQGMVDGAGNPPPPYGWRSHTITAHEMGHGFGFQHSFRYLSPGSNPSHLMYGDPWDLMSADGVYKGPGTFGPVGPGLNAVYLFESGWLSSDEIWTPTGGSGSVTLAPLDRANEGLVRVARIPGVSHTVPVSGAGDLGWPLYLAPGYLTVEYRAGSSWDRGLETPGLSPDPDDVVLVHWGSSDPPWADRSVLLRKPPAFPGMRKDDTYIDGVANLRIDVVDIQPDVGATIQVGPAPSVALSKSVHDESTQGDPLGVHEWPGIPGYCPAKSFEVEAIQKHQLVTVTVDVYGMRSPVTLEVSMGKQTLNKSTGTVAFQHEVQLPHLTQGLGSDPYYATTKQVVIEYSRNQGTIQLRNRPADGTYSVTMQVVATDAAGLQHVASIVIPFHGWILDFGPEYQAYVSGCLMSAIADHLQLIPKTIPVEEVSIPDPTARSIQPHRAAHLHSLQRSREQLSRVAQAVYGPLFEQVVVPHYAINWADRDFEPDVARFRLPGRGR